MELGHAHLCRGTSASIPEVVERMAGSISAADLVVRSYGDLGIDDAREIRERAMLRGLGDGRLFIIAASSITVEAQNALLKTFEEPLAGAQFVILVPSPESLLPTLRSRMHRMHLESEEGSSPIDVRSFLASTPAQRIEMLKPLTAAEERDTAGVLGFLCTLEQSLGATPDGSHDLDALYRTRAYVSDKGALRKSLLEHLALLLPVRR